MDTSRIYISFKKIKKNRRKVTRADLQNYVWCYTQLKNKTKQKKTRSNFKNKKNREIKLTSCEILGLWWDDSSLNIGLFVDIPCLESKQAQTNINRGVGRYIIIISDTDRVLEVPWRNGFLLFRQVEQFSSFFCPSVCHI